ncbi:hypothetical protein HaLaN_01486, partial [Haematococcus lacustris]
AVTWPWWLRRAPCGHCAASWQSWRLRPRLPATASRDFGRLLRMERQMLLRSFSWNPSLRRTWPRHCLSLSRQHACKRTSTGHSARSMGRAVR